MTSQLTTVVFNIQRFSLHDGPGLRTTVFLKGCPLRCQWCANPESIRARSELGFARAGCDRCGQCAVACAKHAITLGPDGPLVIDRARCNACGECIPACRPEALALYGKRLSVTEIFEEVRRDEMFYVPDGGITVSGGEPLTQPGVVTALFKLCREAGIGTCVETCGFAQETALREVAACTDIFLFDLKQMDNAEHQRLTGRSNARILANARVAASGKSTVQFRMPLVPSLNDSNENIQATARFIRGLQGENASIELMPYHRLGMGKYEALGRPYLLDRIQAPEPEHVDRIRRSFEERGVRCLVSR